MQVKVAEFVGESRRSWQEAIENAVSEASTSLSNITGVEVYNWTADCKNNKIVEYKANIKIAYVD
ncbi:MAG: dodecin family protein [Syntrophomonadaceae bacterium]|jgi:flavin-binding protein dodecin